MGWISNPIWRSVGVQTKFYKIETKLLKESHKFMQSHNPLDDSSVIPKCKFVKKKDKKHKVADLKVEYSLLPFDTSLKTF